MSTVYSSVVFFIFKWLHDLLGYTAFCICNYADFFVHIHDLFLLYFFSPPPSPAYVGGYCSTGPKLEDLYDEMDEFETNPPPVAADEIPAALREEEDAHIFENYSFDHTYSPDLPITSYQQQIVDTIESNSVTIIQGELLLLLIHCTCTVPLKSKWFDSSLCVHRNIWFDWMPLYAVKYLLLKRGLWAYGLFHHWHYLVQMLCVKLLSFNISLRCHHY